MKNEKGITLTALIITMIVIFILAGISLKFATGDGIIGTAEKAIQAYQYHNLKEELKTYHAKRELVYEDEDYNPQGLYAYYDRIVYKHNDGTGEVNTDKKIYDILDSLEGSWFDGKVYVDKGEIVFEPGEYKLDNLPIKPTLGELMIFPIAKLDEEKVDVEILYSAKLSEDQKLQYKINNSDLQDGATSESVSASATVPITKEEIESAPGKIITVYACVVNTSNNEIIVEDSVNITVPTPPTDIQITPTENTLEVMATGATDTGLGLAGYQYSIDGGTTWSNTIREGKPYTIEPLTTNTTVHVTARAVNIVGFVSDNYTKDGTTLSLTSVEITPDIPNTNEEGDINWTKNDVLLTLTYRGDNSKVPGGYEIKYTTTDEPDEAKWETYKNPVAIDTKDTTLKTKLVNEFVDDKGQESEYTVINIDKDPPTIPNNVPVTSTKNSLTVQSATGSTDELSGLQGYQYSIDDGASWTDVLTGNTPYTFDGLDSGTEKTIKVIARDNVDLESTPFDQNASTIASYTISFEKNLDRDVLNMPTESLEKLQNENIVLPTETPTAIGYTFLGWSTNNDSTDPEFKKADLENGQGVFTIDAELPLYAIWSANTYTITLDNTGVTTPGTPQLYEKFDNGVYKDAENTSEVTQTENPITTPQLEGYTFDGYYTLPNGEGEQMINQDGYLTENFTNDKFIENVTFYPNFIINQYYIDLNIKVNGQKAVNAQNVEDGYGGRIKANLVIGENEIEPLSDFYQQYDYDTTWAVTSVVIDDMYTIPYEASGTVGVDGATINIDFNTVAFAPNNAELGSVNISNNAENAIVLSNTILEAQGDKITFSYGENDGRIVTVTPSLFTGYVSNLTNWLDSNSNPITSLTIISETTITANFTKTAKTLDVTLMRNLNEEDTESRIQSFTYNETIAPLQGWESEGYTLDHWVDDAGNSYTEITNEIIDQKSPEITLYAQWTKNEYNLSLNFSVNGTPVTNGYNHRIKAQLFVNDELIKDNDSEFIESYNQNIDYGSTWKITALQIDGNPIAYEEKKGTIGTSAQTIDIDFYTIDFTVNNQELGELSVSNMLLLKGSTYNVNDNIIIFETGSVVATPKALTGYTSTFSNWTDQTSAVLSTGTITTATTITANFVKNENTVTLIFHPNGATNINRSIAETPKRNWYDSSTGQTVDMTNTSTVLTDTMYTTQIINYSNSGALSFNMLNVANLFVKTGHHVTNGTDDAIAWLKNSTTSEIYVNQASYNVKALMENGSVEIHLYANWQSNIVTLKYYPNGGTVKDSAKSNQGDEPDYLIRKWYDNYAYCTQVIKYTDSDSENKNIWNVATLFTKTGYHVTNGTDDTIAWLKDSTSSETYVYQNSYNFKVLMENDNLEINLYANWQVNKLKVYYYPNGGSAGGTKTGSDTLIASGQSHAGASTITGEVTYTNPQSRTWYVSELFNRTGYYIDNATAWHLGSADATQYVDQTGYNFSSLLEENIGEIELYANWKSKPVYVYYNSNGGQVTGGQLKSGSTTDERFYADSSGNICDRNNNNAKFVTNVYPGVTTDLINYNNKRNGNNQNGFLNITKNGYVGKITEEWKTQSGDTTFNHDGYVTTYQSLVDVATDKTDHYEVTLYVNWILKPVNIYYKTGGGVVSGGQLYDGVERFSADSDNYVYDNTFSKRVTNSLNVGGTIDLINYNNARTSNTNLSGKNYTSGYVNITKNGYTAPNEKEWKVVSGTKTFNHDEKYTTYDSLIEEAVDKGDHYELELQPNWQPNDTNTKSELDLQIYLDGTVVKNTNAKVGLKVNGTKVTSAQYTTNCDSNGYTCDYLNQSIAVGTSYEVFGVQIYGTNYTLKTPITGNVNSDKTDINVYFYTVNFASNNTNYGTVSSTSMIVYGGTTYSTSGTTLTLGHSNLNSYSQTVTAAPVAQTVQYTYSLSSWSSASDTISSAKTITANFARNTRKYYIDLNIYLDGSKHENDDKLKVGLKVGGTDKGYVKDYYIQNNYGTTYEAYGVQINGTNYTFNSDKKITGTVGQNLTSGKNEIRVDFVTLMLAVNDSTRGGVTGNISETESYLLKDSKLQASSITLTAVHDRVSIQVGKASTKAKTGYWTTFSNWTQGSTVIGNQNVTISSSGTVKANFNETAKWVEVIFMRNHTSSDTEKNEAKFTYQLPDKSQSFNANWSDWNYKKQDRWYLNQECTSSASYEKNSPVSNSWIIANAGKTVTLYAKWIPYTYTLKYYNGSTLLKTETHNAGESFKLSTTTGTQSGYDFYGWTKKTDFSDTIYTDLTQSVSNLSTTNGATVNLYAVWQKANVVTFYSGINKAATNTATQYYNPAGPKYSVTSPSAQGVTSNNVNWTTLGWRDDTTAGAREYEQSKTITTNSSITTFYAVYNNSITFNSGKSNANKSTVTAYYNTNGGFSGTMPTPATLSKASTANENWSTLGWRDNTSAANKQYDKNDSINKLSVKNYYAVYSRKVTCYSGVSKATTNTINPQYYNSNGALSGNLPTPSATTDTSWQAIGWRDDTTAGNKEFDTSGTPSFGADTYYAVYSKNATLIHYDGNGSTGGTAPADQTGTQYYNSNNSYSSLTFTLANNTFTKTGNSINNTYQWREGSTTGTQKAQGTQVTVNKKTNYYSNWSANTYTITVGSTSIKEIYGTEIYYMDGSTKKVMSTNSNPIPVPTQTGYTFGGYYDGSTLMINASGYLTSNFTNKKYTSNKTLTPKWTAKKSTLTLNPNGGTYNSKTGTSTKTMTYDTKDNNSIGVATKEGYDFLGWYTEQSGGTQVYSKVGQNVNVSTYWSTAYSEGKWQYVGNVTLYAHWKAKTCTLTLDPNGGNYGGKTTASTKTMTYDSTNNNSVGKATRSGYYFQGWYTAKTNGTQVYNASGKNAKVSGYWSDQYSAGKWEHVGNVTLYAQWKPEINLTSKKVIPVSMYGGVSLAETTHYNASHYTAYSWMLGFVPKNFAISGWAQTENSYQFNFSAYNFSNSSPSSVASLWKLANTTENFSYSAQTNDYILGLFGEVNKQGQLFDHSGGSDTSIIEARLNDTTNYEFERADNINIVPSITSDVYNDKGTKVASNYKAYVFGHNLNVTYSYTGSNSTIPIYKYYFGKDGNGNAGRRRCTSEILNNKSGTYKTRSEIIKNPGNFDTILDNIIISTSGRTIDLPEIYFFPSDVKISSVVSAVNSSKAYQINNGPYAYKVTINPNSNMKSTQYKIDDGDYITITSSKTIYITKGTNVTVKVTDKAGLFNELKYNNFN